MRYRWHIFLADLEPVIGSEQGKKRPVLVMSEEDINQILPVVNVLPITSRKPGRNIYPNEVLLSAGTANLAHDSIVLCYKIRTLDKQRLIRTIGKIDETTLQESIIESLCFQLGIIQEKSEFLIT